METPSPMTPAELAKLKTKERKAKAYQAIKEQKAKEYELIKEQKAKEYQLNKDEIAKRNAERKEEISLKNAKAYEMQKKKIEAMSWKETDEFFEARSDKAREYYEKNKDTLKEKQEQREIAKAIKREPNRLHYRRDQIRLHKLDPVLYPYNPETDLVEPKKKRVHKPKNNEENKIICAVQHIDSMTPVPTPAKKSKVKVNVKVKMTPRPAPAISNETSNAPAILKYKLGEFYDETDEFIYFEEMSEEELFGCSLGPAHEIKKAEYKKHMLNYNKYMLIEIEREMNGV